MIRFKVRCVKDTVNPASPANMFWRAGQEYSCETYRFENFYIQCERTFENPYDRCLTLQEFRQYFTTDYRMAEDQKTPQRKSA